MPHKLPVVSGKQLICFLQKLGYTEERQQGTLNDILTKIALNNQLPKEQLIKHLREI